MEKKKEKRRKWRQPEEDRKGKGKAMNARGARNKGMEAGRGVCEGKDERIGKKREGVRIGRKRRKERRWERRR